MEKPNDDQPSMAKVVFYAVGCILACVGIYLGHVAGKRPARPAEPAGSYIDTQLVGGSDGGTVAGFTPQGPVIGIVSGGSEEKSVVKTDQGTFIVRGSFAAKRGAALEVQTLRRGDSQLCIQGTDQCNDLLPNG
jgi:hypothetical protein